MPSPSGSIAARALAASAVLAMLTFGSAAPATAQAMAAVTPSAYQPYQIVPDFPPDQIRRALDQAQADEQAARQAVDSADARERRASARRDIVKSEIETLKKRADLANKEKRAGDKLDLDRQRGAAEVLLKATERLIAVNAAEEDVAKKQVDVARAEQNARRSELDLTDRRTRRATFSSADSAALRSLDQDIGSLTRQVIQRWRDLADQRGQLADRQKTLASRQLDLYSAQEAVGSLR